MGDAITEKNIKANGIGGHALVMSLKYSFNNNSTTSYYWPHPQNSNTSDLNTSLFPSATTQNMVISDFRGYEKTQALIAVSSTKYWAAAKANDYNTIYPISNTTGWFLPSAGQFNEALKNLCNENTDLGIWNIHAGSSWFDEDGKEIIDNKLSANGILTEGTDYTSFKNAHNTSGGYGLMYTSSRYDNVMIHVTNRNYSCFSIDGQGWDSKGLVMPFLAF